jgi:AcrR family transcriptional regulator
MYSLRLFFFEKEKQVARKTKAEAERTRARILKAALSLFAEKGYDRTTFEKVAQCIRLSKGAVYWHFKSKPDLLTAVVEQMTARYAVHLKKTLPLADSLEGLKAHMVARAKFIVGTPDNRKFFKMMLLLDWPAPKFAPLKQRLRQLETGPFFIIEKVLREARSRGVLRPDVDVLEVRDVLGAMWMGLINLDVCTGLEADLSDAVEFDFESVFARIRA